jgi:hypothetical protein
MAMEAKGPAMRGLLMQDWLGFVQKGLNSLAKHLRGVQAEPLF